MIPLVYVASGPRRPVAYGQAGPEPSAAVERVLWAGPVPLSSIRSQPATAKEGP